MIHLLKEKSTSTQIHEMLERYENMIKIVIRPRSGNRSILRQDENLRRQVEGLTNEILRGVR